MSTIEKVVWTNTARNQLKSIYNYYKEKSIQGANNVKNDILAKEDSLCRTVPKR
ncbi:type II toxin-antitoxin system RelE/ParE family toxin [Flavobacterium cupreum]|uniref:Type II toxin-antitoxin system RelE/ParE family toxin n=1 Tax=Flavobacterium cupreum TaxID=2133766 RepID=A0A434AAS2_9FLAO|nr:type II toxin-antitoxin system RelE/ParE family toxin [Flavobacterium cupreum]RUT71402.1 type II toxin-antitoxin system RelE/ParE family toxin [Flavobacterium cupreum]